MPRRRGVPGVAKRVNLEGRRTQETPRRGLLHSQYRTRILPRGATIKKEAAGKLGSASEASQPKRRIKGGGVIANMIKR